MAAKVTNLFDFLAGNNGVLIDRHEVSSTDFGDLRSSLWALSTKLMECEDELSVDAAEKLRALLSELLTVPVNINLSVLERICNHIGTQDDVENRWGGDAGRLYLQVSTAIENLHQTGNPLRDVLEECLFDATRNNHNLKIYCHRRARSDYESILPPELDSERTFLHTVTNYRDTEIFDILIKVGPLRSRGWGAIPDAVLTAPKYPKMINVVWSGCANAPDFGYEPTRSIELITAGSSSNQIEESHGVYTPSWNAEIKRHGEDTRKGTRTEILVDELSLISQPNNQEDLRNAVLVQIDQDHGVLLPPNSLVMSLDPKSNRKSSINQRSVYEDLVEGMFLIIVDQLDFDLGGLQAELGFYSQIWREKLEQTWFDSPDELIEKLKAAGLDLVRLDLAIPKWIRLPDTVIHAPQRKDHFHILLNTLGFDESYRAPGQEGTTPFEILAWNEIRASRGEAIQAGVQEHELVEEQLLEVLREDFENIFETCKEKSTFYQIIPANSGITGKFRFFKILNIETGFTVPWPRFRAIHELELIDQWRN